MESLKETLSKLREELSRKEEEISGLLKIKARLNNLKFYHLEFKKSFKEKLR